MLKYTFAAFTILFLAACSRPDANPAQSIPAPVTFVFAGTPTQPPAPTSTPAPTPTATPTPDPVKLLADAAKARWLGDDLSATQFYSAALPFLPATSQTAQTARLALAESLRDMGDHASAERHLRALTALTSTIGQDAKIILGRMAQVDGNPTGAIPFFQEALAAGTAMSSTLNVWLGDAHLALNQPISALLSLSNAVASALNVNMQVGYREKLALAHQMNGNTPAALAQYEAILGVAKISAYRARILWASAQTMQAAGSLPQAYARMREAMAQDPTSPAAFTALNALVQAGQPVDETGRGIVDFHNEAYAAAQQAFARAIAEPGNQTPAKLNEIRWWAAQNYIALGDSTGALRNLNQIIAEGAAAPRFADAALKKGEYLARLSDIDGALAAYAALQKAAPGSATSAQAAQKAARTLENAGQMERAAAAYLAAQKQFPAADGADEMLLRAAFLQYRLGKFAETISTTAQLQSAYANGAYAGAARLWQAKAQIGTGDGAYTRTLTALAAALPESYESERAAELLLNPAAPPLSRTLALRDNALAETCRDDFVFVCLPSDEGKAEAETWLRGWLGISDTVNVSAVGAAIRQDARFAQGNELWRLGFKPEAMTEFQSLLNANARDPLSLWQLALHFRGLGAFRLSISAADALARAATNAPPFLGRMVYPAYYGGLISAYAKEFGVDPLLAFSLVRQESLFEPFAESGAAANGLFQVIPSTGKEIAAQLGWPPNYETGDLQRPLVSARFGLYYMSRQRKTFGDWFSALAAYNGGPGSAAIWQDRAGDDYDVFAGIISFRETSSYVQKITANYAAYARLYAR